MASSSTTPPSQSSTIEVTFITSNVNKLKEVQAILSSPVPSSSPSSSSNTRHAQQSLDIRITNKDLPVPEIQGSIDEICIAKCRAARQLVKGPVLVEDTALCFTALGGLPGSYIKWFLAAIGLQGLNNLLSAYEDKSAAAVCTFAYSDGIRTSSDAEGDHDDVLLFQGRTPGKIVPPRGSTNFGWDPIFEHDGKTYAEMTATEKNAVSHRYKALMKMREHFLSKSSSAS